MCAKTLPLLLLLSCILAPNFAWAETPVRILILIRHGAYNDSAADNGHAPLTPLGVAQARLVATRLKTLVVAPTELVSSTMTRAEQTAAIIHAELPTVPEHMTDVLRECSPPMPAAVKVSTQDQDDAVTCRRQLDEAFATYFKPSSTDENDILVCHGNVIRYFITKALGIDPKLWTHFSLGHTSLTEIHVRADGSMRVISVGDVGHLPANLQSGTESTVPTLEPPSEAR